MATRLGIIVQELGGQLRGDPARVIDKLAPLESACSGDLGFLANPKYKASLERTLAGAVIVSAEAAASVPEHCSAIVTPDPYHYFALLTQWWKRRHMGLDDGPRIHPTAVIHPQAQVHADARVGALCVVEREAVVGADTVLHARVMLGAGCRVGARCILHSGVVIGADGFGFALHEGRWEKIEQLGAVVIGDDVEIGANTCVDRGALTDTVIEDGVKLDNLIQIGHNVRIGRHTAMAGCVGVAGSATIGAHCTVGGGAVILGHLSLADRVHISAASVVTRSIHQAGHYTGIFPIDDNAHWERNAAALKQLAVLRQRIRELENLIQKP
jgi:UDP-3-O-[3-hydroxymyristoyl] glucosamine N-acyltransferase